jgi:hypothetical protein
MNMVLAGFTAVFGFAALCGFIIGRWSVRRSFVDVTESYGAMAKAIDSDVPWDMIWARFDSVDVNTRLIVREELNARLARQGPAQ